MTETTDPMAKSDAQIWLEVAHQIVDDHESHGSIERLLADIAKRLWYEYGRGCKTADNRLQHENYTLRQRIAKLESDAAKLSGIMREYSQGYHDVCQQLKAASVETVSALPTDSHEVQGFTVIDLGQ